MNNNILRKAMLPILLIITITVVACYLIITEYNNEKRRNARENSLQSNSEESITEETVDIKSLEYQASGVLIAKDADKKTVTLKPLGNGKDFLLEYDGTTSFLGKHGNSMTIDQLQLGDIVDVVYSVHNGKLKTLSMSQDSWTMTNVSKFDINEKRKQLTVGDDTFKIDENLVISYGQELAKLMDITDLDTLSIKGVDRKIFSIIVERGHGYIRIKNDAYFVGGWLEVGTDIIKPITSEMLVPVPEGAYHVKVTNRGYAGQKDMIIERDKEEILDLDEIDIEEVAIGHVQFEIDPDFAQLYIDGEMTDFDERVPLEFGIHKVHVEMAGYESVDTNIKILSDYANVKIALEEAEEESTESSSSTVNKGPNTSSSSILNEYGVTTYPSATYSSDPASSTVYSSDPAASSSNPVVVSDTRQIYVEAPTGAEVYLDGNYVGIAPAHTNKVTGQHVLTLSKSGYATKSYTINVDNDDRDVTFSFSDLIAE